MGTGRVRARTPGDPEQGHFGLAVEDYTHSTAPNRRFADLATQGLVKAVLAHHAPPYTDNELQTIAANCTSKADAARKVERDMAKRLTAVAMSGRTGEAFDAIVRASRRTARSSAWCTHSSRACSRKATKGARTFSPIHGA
jgi:exoribonuclease II